MNNQDNIGNLILTHWQNYHPKMIAQFKQENRLEAELEATAQQFCDLMYELTVVKKMPYQSAWEIAVEQFLLPSGEESSSTSQNQPGLPATSA